MKRVINIILGICTVGGFFLYFIPLDNKVNIKYLILAIFIFITILICVITNFCLKIRELGNYKIRAFDVDCTDKTEPIVYFKKHPVFHVDALVCLYKDRKPNAELIAIGEVNYCEDEYTTIRIIKLINQSVIDEYLCNRANIAKSLYVRPAFKYEYIKYLEVKEGL